MNTSSRQATEDDPTNALVLEHLPIVGYVVREYLNKLPRHVNSEDLASAGHMALVKAARAFNPELGVPFSRYANLRIRGAVIDELRGMDWATREGRKRVKALQAVSAQMGADLGRVPTRDELASVMGVSVDAIDDTRSLAESSVLSLDMDATSVTEWLADGSPTPEAQLVQKERLRFLVAGVDVLPERLRFVITGSFFEDRTDDDLADELGVSPSRISQIRTEALSLMRDALNDSFDPDMVTASENPDGVAQRRRLAYFAAMAARAAGGSQMMLGTQVASKSRTSGEAGSLAA